MTSPLRFAVIGCGLMGRKRALSINNDARIVLCCDVDGAKANQLAAELNVQEVSTEWQAAITRADVDAVFVCTTHDKIAAITAAAAAEGKHVLFEKPGGRRSLELDAVTQTGVCIRAGFNHRYHRAFQKARAIFDSGSIGKLLFVRGRYGHGGRPRYETEWRADPVISGGGEAIDQGVHLIDLARWFLGDLRLIGGKAATYFWNMPVEDNAFFLLETDAGQIAQLHAGWTEWKNIFSFEICGQFGRLEISGLGGSYGVERLTHYQMQPKMGPPETTIYEYPMADNSWQIEFNEFMDDIRLARSSQPGIIDAQAALKIVEALYAQSR